MTCVNMICMCWCHQPTFSLFFFFNDTATTEIYTLSLHDALPISERHHDPNEGDRGRRPAHPEELAQVGLQPDREQQEDRKSTRLNSSHANISYAVFCLKKKKNKQKKAK